MSDLATGRTPSFSAAESIALYASSRRTWAKAAQREWKGLRLTSRLGKHRADVADSAGAAAPDPPAAASGTLGCELPFKFHSPWLKRRLVSSTGSEPSMLGGMEGEREREGEREGQGEEEGEWERKIERVSETERVHARGTFSAAAILSSYRLMSDLAAGRPGSACEAGGLPRRACGGLQNRR